MENPLHNEVFTLVPKRFFWTCKTTKRESPIECSGKQFEC